MVLPKLLFFPVIFCVIFLAILFLRKRKLISICVGSFVVLLSLLIFLCLGYVDALGGGSSCLALFILGVSPYFSKLTTALINPLNKRFVYFTILLSPCLIQLFVIFYVGLSGAAENYMAVVLFSEKKNYVTLPYALLISSLYFINFLFYFFLHGDRQAHIDGKRR